MYAYIKGIVGETGADRAVIEAAGVGYELMCSTMTLKTLILGREAKLYTHLHLAEGVQALYGFADTEERDMFRKLLNVSRIGPKVALSVLSSMTPSDVRAAIVTDNPAAFDHVVGMGRKTAQRVILELGESIRQENVGMAPLKAADTKPTIASMQSEAVAALTSLGYDGLTASRAVAKIKEADSVEELITKALRSMAKG
ncbi:MAG: Holliday junction branch migration protein RuvA [Clostridia bacterium]|nr:Holliday junction branch migration protein RuvA [Clostridia bacterium]